jgi:hypothetical protein
MMLFVQESAGGEKAGATVPAYLTCLKKYLALRLLRHFEYVQYSRRSLFLLSPFCCRSLSRYKKGSYGTKHPSILDNRSVRGGSRDPLKSIKNLTGGNH